MPHLRKQVSREDGLVPVTEDAEGESSGNNEEASPQASPQLRDEPGRHTRPQSQFLSMADGTEIEVDCNTWFPVEHLASVKIEMRHIYNPSIEDGVWAIKEFGGFWTKTMDLNVSPDSVVLQDDQSHKELSRHSIGDITQTGVLLDEEDFGDVFCFITKHNNHHKVHIFQVLEGFETVFDPSQRRPVTKSLPTDFQARLMARECPCVSGNSARGGCAAPPRAPPPSKGAASLPRSQCAHATPLDMPRLLYPSVAPSAASPPLAVRNTTLHRPRRFAGPHH